MKNFLENVIRYQRFFISSLTGLTIIILNPIIQKFKQGKVSAISTLIVMTLFIQGLRILIHTMLNV